MPFTTAPVDTSAYYVPVLSPEMTGRHALRRAVGSALERGARHIVVDCSSWQDQDLALLSSLIACAGLCAVEGAQFELRNLDSSVRETLNELRLAPRLGLALEQ